MTPSPEQTGQAITLKATVTRTTGSGSPTGTVTFYFGTNVLTTASLSAGVATYTTLTTGFPPGAYGVTAKYNGDSGDAASTSALYEAVIAADATTTTVAISEPSITEPAIATLTATVARSTVAGIPSGMVAFSIGGQTFATASLNVRGTATFLTSTAGLPADTYSIAATYTGDALDAASTSGSVAVALRAPVQYMDYSTSGYAASAAAIPTATVEATVAPSGTDDTGAIQAAIHAVSALPLNQTTGLRGAVLLEPGSFTVSDSLTINASGVVLRGSGSGTSLATNTVITMRSATTPYPLVVLGSSTVSPTYVGSSIAITDSYVPAGSLTVDVASTAGLAVGDSLMVKRPATTAWIAFMDMLPDELGPDGECSSGACNWINVSDYAFLVDRVITAINGNSITLDAALPDSIDSVYLGAGVADVQAFTFPDRITNAGVEDFRVIAPVPANNLVSPTATYQLVVTYSLMNGWVRNLTAQDPLQAIEIEKWGKQITVSNVSLTHTVTQTEDVKFEDYYINQATQVLMDTVSDESNGLDYFGTSGETEGPLVLRNAVFSGNGNVESHQRWATGLLIENTTVNSLDGGMQGEINLWDRGNYGTGEGWTLGDGVIWNSTAGSFIVQQPPGSQNWCIGCIGAQIVIAAPPSTGSVLPQGMIESPGKYVLPASLYASQLSQRLGSDHVGTDWPAARLTATFRCVAR